MTKPAPAPRVSIGTLVTNVKMEEWGPGKILELTGTVGTVHFRDLPNGTQVRKIGLSFLTFAPEQSDPALDLVGLPKAKTSPGRRRKLPARAKKKPAAPAVAAEPEPEAAPEPEAKASE